MVAEHDGGRNHIYICSCNENTKVLRLSLLNDKTMSDYLGETEFIHFLARKGAPVADVIPSVNGNLVECINNGDGDIYACLFKYAKGVLLYDVGYRLSEGMTMEKYFYNTGKTLGAIHRLSKEYKPVNKRISYFDKYNMEYINRLIPDTFKELKDSIADRIEKFKKLPMDPDDFGLVHFDYSDGNYHIDMNSGEITIFDFDNCMYCWYMFDLANLWTHGEGWFRFEQDPVKRSEYMRWYFETCLKGYRTETDVSSEMLDKIQLFVDMVLIENIVDEFESCSREGEDIDSEDIEDAARILIDNVPFDKV